MSESEVSLVIDLFPLAVLDRRPRTRAIAATFDHPTFAKPQKIPPP